MNRQIFLIVSIVLLVVIVAGAYLYLQGNRAKAANPEACAGLRIAARAYPALLDACAMARSARGS